MDISHFYVPFIVCFEADPFFAVMLGQVAGSSSVCFGWLAGCTEEADQVFFPLLISVPAGRGQHQLQQGRGSPEIGGPDHLCISRRRDPDSFRLDLPGCCIL